MADRADDEMIEGYRDGLKRDSPEPTDNRTESYRHGFANGRDDLAVAPRACADVLRRLANAAMELDQ